LVRGKAGRIMASHQAMLTTLKGLPLAYNKDMQEDKAGLFGAVDEVRLCVRVTATVVRTMEVDVIRSRELAGAGYTNATDLADYLVAKGVPFREAHETVGRAVNIAVERGVALEALPLEALRSVSAAIEDDVYTCLRLEAVLSERSAFGGTAPARVREAAAAARERW
jgi:argininosuccinate lyase